MKENLDHDENAASILPHNYSTYHHFENPKKMKHLTYVNPDELIKHSDRVLTTLRGRDTKYDV